MIGYIKGTVSYIGENYVLLDNHGIGYRIFIPAGYTDSGLRAGDEVRLYTYLSVREDALTLFGFLSQDDLEMFRMMLNVSGLGPKGALGILSVLSADDLRFAVLSDDAKAIAKAPGVGQKTAQKLILELKDKLRLEDAFEKKMEHQMESAEKKGAVVPGGGAEADAIQALAALGYSNTEAFRAVHKVEISADMDSEAVLKAALKYLI
ncbi:MAG: Holliday junction branch migration protein RuvA [Lachnospiraceae bacterium]|nr:Holliday junction branch migration protein RuvA [Lachnospiraceae bacterium]MDD6685639.1 Holliday junction branch migration protein RuvA [Lachnospiraceae bacterium]MDD7048819.1 Holliday junction branch migration protein RuvA [Lachnospiraceae bacterium]